MERLSVPDQEGRKKVQGWRYWKEGSEDLEMRTPLKIQDGKIQEGKKQIICEWQSLNLWGRTKQEDPERGWIRWRSSRKIGRVSMGENEALLSTLQ